MKKIFFSFLLFICLCCVATAQQKLKYSYDASGNRISREIHIPINKGKALALTSAEEVYSDTLGNIEVKIAPNPTKGKLTVWIQQLPENTPVALGIYNPNGQLIIGTTEYSNSIDLDISDSPIGTYFLRIQIGDYNTSWKIIKH